MAQEQRHTRDGAIDGLDGSVGTPPKAHNVNVT